MTAIDLNSDLGESYGAWTMGDDEAILSIVSSANVACGFHAGDPLGIFKTVKAAAEKGVAIGAHVSYPDRVGFGRRDMDVTPAELTADVIYQIGALKGVAAAAGVSVGYVKPHGALYNRIAYDPKQGQAVIDGIKAVDPELVLMGLAGAPILDLARRSGLKVVAEAVAGDVQTADFKGHVARSGARVGGLHGDDGACPLGRLKGHGEGVAGLRRGDGPQGLEDDLTAGVGGVGGVPNKGVGTGVQIKGGHGVWCPV